METEMRFDSLFIMSTSTTALCYEAFYDTCVLYNYNLERACMPARLCTAGQRKKGSIQFRGGCET